MQSNQDKLTRLEKRYRENAGLPDKYSYGQELVTIQEIRMALRKRYPSKSKDALAYQWQRAIDNVENGELMPSYDDPSNYVADKRLALGLLLNVFGTDIHGNEINED